MHRLHQALRSCRTCVAVVNQFVPPVTEYVRLAAIRVRKAWSIFEIDLLCEMDERGEAFSVPCSLSNVLHLQPYATLLRGYQQGESLDQPVVPVRRLQGSLAFDPSVAEQDYPELVPQLSEYLSAALLPDFAGFAADLADLS